MSSIQVIDSLIEDVCLEKNENRIQLKLNELACAIGHYLSCDPPIKNYQDLVDKQTLQKKNKRFIAISILRIFSKNFSVVEFDKHFEKRCYDLIDELGDVYSHLELKQSAQNYEKKNALVGFVENIEGDISKLFDHVSIDRIDDFKQKFISKFFKDSIYKSITQIYLLDLLDQNRIVQIFDQINRYNTESGEIKLQYFRKSKSSLCELIEDANSINSLYSRIVIKRGFSSLLSSLEEDFSSDPYSASGKIQVKSTGKKYPILDTGRFFFVDLEIKNISTGIATEVEVEITENDFLSFEKNKILLQTKSNGSVVRNIQCHSLRPSHQVIIHIVARWTNFDDSRSEEKFNLELNSQNSNVNWAEIRHEEPYSLEAVELSDELFGRVEIINQLIAKAKSRRSGSSYVFGQKRTGKTSIVKSLENLLNSVNFRVIYLSGGAWSTNTPQESLNNLGRRICQKLASKNPSFKSLTTPDFNGDISKITEYFEEIYLIDPEIKILIILDEFDSINPDLYKSGIVAKSFLLTIRDLASQFSNLSFILVGAENLDNILAQWQELNKFSPFQVSYFNKEKEWDDYKNLVKKPIEEFNIEIDDRVIDYLFEYTAGNPYFTKLICAELFNLLIENRDSYGSVKEIEIAKNKCNENQRATAFSHFWEDGIKLKNDAEITSKRKKILLILAELLNKKEPVKFQNIVDLGRSRDIKEKEISQILNEYCKREILLYDDKRSDYRFVLKFFSEWLVNHRDELRSTFIDSERLIEERLIVEGARIKPEEIDVLFIKWEDYRYKGEKISREKIKKYLNQFEEFKSQRTIYELLTYLIFYDEKSLNAKMEDFYRKIKVFLKSKGVERQILKGKQKREDVLISWLEQDDATKSGAKYMKLFSDKNEKEIYKGNNSVYSKISERINDNSKIKVIAFFDDFSGSGDQVSGNLIKLNKDHGETIRAKKVFIFIGIVCGFESAKIRIEDTLKDMNMEGTVEFLDLLTEKDKLFSSESSVFDQPMSRREAKDLCIKFGTNLEKNHPLGYSDCQTLIVFPDTCPNNSLPILWKKTHEWMPLFERSY